MTNNYYDITDSIPVLLSNPQAQQTYYPTGVAYDVSIGGQPFFLLNDDMNPYRSVTAQYRKQQIDQSREPGEQTLTGWWLRSQSSFHLGQGVTFFEPAQDESLRFQYTYSKGCDVWTKGQITLLPNVFTSHLTTDPIASNGRPFQFSRSIHWDGKDGILLHDGYDVDKIDVDGNETHFINYNAGTEKKVYAICDDGVYAYWITVIDDAGVTKTAMYKKALTADYTTAGTLMWKDSSIVATNAVLEYTKERIVGAINNKIYEWATSAAALGTPVYTHPDTDVVFTSITSSGVAIYFAAYSGAQSNIYKFTLQSTGAMPTLTSAITAAEMPVGEKIFRIAYYLGNMAIGTSLGLRVAAVSDTDGSIAYGPLLFESEQPVYDVCFRDKFLWCATNVDGHPGLTRVNLGQQITSLVYAYAWDLFDPETTGKTTTSCAFAGFTDKILFTTAGITVGTAITNKALTSNVVTLTTQTAHGLTTGDSVWVEGVGSPFDSTTGPYTVTGTPTTTTFTYAKTNANIASSAATGLANIPGSIYVQDPAELTPDGTLRTGFVRYNTIENKIFKYVVPRFDTSFGSLQVYSVDQYNIMYGLGTFTEGSTITEVGINYPTGPQQYLGFEFIFSRSGVDPTMGPTFTGYQVKTLPGIPRQYLLQYPCSLYDSESDKFGNKAGYEGAAYDRLKTIKQLESNGDTLKIEDFRTGEVYTGIIEETDFINKTPTDKRYSGYGGLLLITVRTIS